MTVRLRLNSDVRVLDEWATTACQADVNAVYEVLFAVVEHSVFAGYEVFSDRSAHQLSVVIHSDLVARIGLSDEGCFDILYIGSPDSSRPADAPTAES